MSWGNQIFTFFVLDSVLLASKEPKMKFPGKNGDLVNVVQQKHKLKLVHLIKKRILTSR